MSEAVRIREHNGNKRLEIYWEREWRPMKTKRLDGRLTGELRVEWNDDWSGEIFHEMIEEFAEQGWTLRRRTDDRRVEKRAAEIRARTSPTSIEHLISQEVAADELAINSVTIWVQSVVDERSLQEEEFPPT